MRSVADYQRLAAAPREPADQLAMELMANGLDKAADEYALKLRNSGLIDATPETREPATSCNHATGSFGRSEKVASSTKLPMPGPTPSNLIAAYRTAELLRLSSVDRAEN